MKGSRFLLFFCGTGIVLLNACMPEMPATSEISIVKEKSQVDVNQSLYGLNIEEINHAIDGGLYAELIQNGNFELGVLPANCYYNSSLKAMITPNGLQVPFIRPDSIIGWSRLSSKTYLSIDKTIPISLHNLRSLSVYVASGGGAQGGVVAEGYKGFYVESHKQYRFSTYSKGNRPIVVSIRDSVNGESLSEDYSIDLSLDWKKHEHVFQVNKSSSRAILVFKADSLTSFNLDAVSLQPIDTWKGRVNGQRKDLVEKISALNPSFIRFPGGDFVEGFFIGTYPVWNESVGTVSDRRSFWNIWGYGSSNGMGYHEFLQLCEDLGAEPIYVVNSGITNQERRPRYENIVLMNKMVQNTLDAIAYAVSPSDSIYGKMRAANGHPKPYNLKYIEIGSSNYGVDYDRRFELFKKAIEKEYPDIIVIKNSRSYASKHEKQHRKDYHFHSNRNFFISNHNRFNKYENNIIKRLPQTFIGEFGNSVQADAGTLYAAIGEACFLVGAENSPEVVTGIAYSPVLGNMDYDCKRYPLIPFNREKAIESISYHVYNLFSNHRGNRLLKTKVNTYERPNITEGKPSIYMFDNAYDLKNITIDGENLDSFEIKSGSWKLQNENFIPAANKWNYATLGKRATYNCDFKADICRTKGSGQIEFRFRDNGLIGDDASYIAFTLGLYESKLLIKSGTTIDTLCKSKPYLISNHKTYRVKVTCKEDSVHCYVNDTLLHKVKIHSLPNIVAVSTVDTVRNELYLKVVNTTLHEERTLLNLNGLSVKNEAEVIEISGSPENINTFDKPNVVFPKKKTIEFPFGSAKMYTFLPNSVTLLKMKIDD